MSEQAMIRKGVLLTTEPAMVLAYELAKAVLDDKAAGRVARSWAEELIACLERRGKELA